ncbi:MAG: GldG family protein [Anaerolineae bacterium]|nr:GldG family protein [Anaerolineae bacterium]
MNKISPKQLASYSLGLAGIGLLATIGLFIVQRSFSLAIQISLGVTLVAFLTYILLDPKRVLAALRGRQARYGSNAFILTVAFVGILVVINLLVARNPVRWDLTDDKTNSLTQQSLDILKSLKEPVTVTAYFTARSSSTAARELLDNYKVNSAGQISYEFVDPEQDPVKATADKVTRDGILVLKQGGRSEQVAFTNEQEFTSALLRLSNPGERAVYFLTGHGEYSPDDAGDQSYASAKTSLQAKNYTVSTLNLLAERSIPANALAIIVAGPDQSISQDEMDLIKAYLDNGGSLVYLSEPTVVTQIGEQPDLLSNYLAEVWGINLSNDMVIDLTYNPPTVAVSANYGQHAITEKMYNLASVFPSARSITIAPSLKPEISITPLITTATNSWGETNLAGLTESKVNYDEGVDLPGPVTLAVSGLNSTTNARVVVIGDSDFASTVNFAQYGNGDFLLNSIDWASKQDNLISLTPKQSTQRVLILRDQTTLGLILLGTVFLLPGIVLISGFAVWFQRRRRG